jgi:hypothetical protein
MVPIWMGWKSLERAICAAMALSGCGFGDSMVLGLESWKDAVVWERMVTVGAELIRALGQFIAILPWISSILGTIRR